METDERTQELFDAAKDYIEWRRGAPTNVAPFQRLQEAVKVLERRPTAQILGEVSTAMADCNLIDYIRKSENWADIYKALGEAIQAWNTIQQAIEQTQKGDQT